MNKQHVTLTESDRQTLQELVAGGQLSARSCKRALALLALDRGQSLVAVAETLGINYNTVAAWRDAYQSEAKLKFLTDQPRSGRPPRIDGTQRAHITALACSAAPAGYARWNLRLLAEKVVELGYCDGISHTQVRKLLKKTN